MTRSSMGDALDEDDVEAEDGVLFYVNKGGFPIPNNTWERMWNHVAKIHPGGHAATDPVRDKKTLTEVLFNNNTKANTKQAKNNK